MNCTLVSGPDLHKAIEKAHYLGATVEHVRKTGEYRFRHPPYAQALSCRRATEGRPSAPMRLAEVIGSDETIA